MPEERPKDRPHLQRPVDDTDYERRTTINLVAVIALLILGGVLYFAIDLIDRQRKLERCLSTGRRDCGQTIDAAPRGPVAPLPR
jgi:hypothetical protein